MGRAGAMRDIITSVWPIVASVYASKALNGMLKKTKTPDCTAVQTFQVE